MVFDFHRLFYGFSLIFILLISFIFNLDYLLLTLIFVVILFELYQSKILIFKLHTLILIPFLFSFLYLFFNNNFYFLFFSFLIFFIFSLVFKKYLNFFFIILLILSFLFFFKLSLIDRNLFYLLFLFSFINDTSAFIFGKTIKGPKILPNISPNKTWSGTTSSFIISFLLLRYFEINIYFSIIVSASFFFCDIYFSYIKRKNNLKDYSNLIKGHGGLLDRMDSILFPSVILFFNIL